MNSCMLVIHVRIVEAYDICISFATESGLRLYIKVETWCIAELKIWWVENFYRWKQS